MWTRESTNVLFPNDAQRCEIAKLCLAQAIREASKCGQIVCSRLHRLHSK